MDPAHQTTIESMESKLLAAANHCEVRRRACRIAGMQAVFPAALVGERVSNPSAFQGQFNSQPANPSRVCFLNHEHAGLRLLLGWGDSACGECSTIRRIMSGESLAHVPTGLPSAYEHFCGRERVQSGFPLQPLDFGVEGRGQVHDQGLDVAQLMLNRQHRDALRHEVVDQEVLSRRNHQKRSRTVLP